MRRETILGVQTRSIISGVGLFSPWWVFMWNQNKVSTGTKKGYNEHSFFTHTHMNVAHTYSVVMYTYICIREAGDDRRTWLFTDKQTCNVLFSLLGAFLKLCQMVDMTINLRS